MNRSWSRTLIVALLQWLDYKTLQLLFILFFQNPSKEDGGNYIVKAVNEMGDKDCTLALNFGNISKLQGLLHEGW